MANSVVLSFRVPSRVLDTIEALACRIERIRPIQGKPSRTEVVLMGLDALNRALGLDGPDGPDGPDGKEDA